MITSFKKIILGLFLILQIPFAVLGQQFDFSEIPKIRVYISAAPGMGHQSASIVVMRRLRQVGFDGEFHVVYSDLIASKLPSLLPGFDPNIKGSQVLKNFKIEAISESEFFSQPNVEKVKFAVTGADDNRTHLSPQKLGSESYLLMEPLSWGDSFYFEGNNPARPLLPLRSMGYFFETDSSPQKIDAALAQMTDDGQGARAEGLRNILATDTHLGAIYGIGTIPSMTTKIKLWVETLEKAARSEKLEKPVILPIISPQNEFERLTLKHALSEISFPPSLKRPPQILLKDLSDPDLPNQLQSLRKGDILLVNVGRIPQTLFENLFERSDLPVLVAGKNAMNLAQNLGKVYVNTVNDASLSKESSPEAKQQSQRVHDIFSSASSRDGDKRLLVQFFKDAFKSDSNLRKMHQQTRQNAADKVVEALRLIDFRELAPSCSGVFL